MTKPTQFPLSGFRMTWSGARAGLVWCGAIVTTAAAEGRGSTGMTTSSGGGASRSGRRRRTGENRGDLIFAVIQGTKLQNVSQYEGWQGSVGHGVQSVHFAYHLCLACLKAADLENRNVMSSHRLPRRSRPRLVTLYVVVVVDRLTFNRLA